LKKKWQIVLLGGLALLVLSLALAWVSTDFRSVNGWSGVFILNLLSVDCLLVSDGCYGLSRRIGCWS
jgi:hypothetical protein